MAEGVQSAEQNKQRRFAAFMSYAHADAAIAAKLQARLERYRLPKHLAQSHTGGQAALGQIFRDREDLAAAPSLSDAIRDAISEADALVVICSPDAVASRWVGEEIALFRSLHPDRPILAAVVRGAPTEAFPAALTEGGNEPLAADLRKEADGPSLGFLKIVAGIAGVPLDALVQRDAQRRIRRVMWITGGAITAMLIMSVMTTLALSARNEAARQRAEAEGLVEYMLTDLREKLKGVGRLDIMGAVNDRAKAYYGGDSIKGRLLNAQTLHAMGEDFEKRGELDKAAIKFSEAHKATSALIKARPDNADVVFTHAQSEYWVGRIPELQKDWRSAQAHYEKYLKLTEQLAAVDANKRRALFEIGHANINLGIVEMSGNGKPEIALILFQRALATYEKAAKLGSDTSAQIYFRSNAAAWIADTFFITKKFQASLASRQLELKLNQEVESRDTHNAQATYLVAKTRLAIAKNLIELKRYVEAANELTSAQIAMAGLIALDPSNDDWAYQYFRVVSNLAIVSKKNGTAKRAETHFSEAVQFASRYENENSELFEKMTQGMIATRQILFTK